jgi:hypothetical protein
MHLQAVDKQSGYIVTTSSQGVLEEYLSTDQLLDGQYDSAKFVKCLNRNDV